MTRGKGLTPPARLCHSPFMRYRRAPLSAPPSELNQGSIPAVAMVLPTPVKPWQRFLLPPLPTGPVLLGAPQHYPHKVARASRFRLSRQVSGLPRPTCSATTSPTRWLGGTGASRRFALLPWLALLACAQPLQAALPPGWTDADIGSPALAGAASFTAGLWSLSGGGADICTYDQLHFASKLVTGDGLLVARVESLQNAPAAQAGVMFRNDLSAGSLEVAVLVSANSGVSFQWRSSPAVSCSYQVVLDVPSLGAPIWLSLARSWALLTASSILRHDRSWLNLAVSISAEAWDLFTPCWASR